MKTETKIALCSIAMLISAVGVLLGCAIIVIMAFVR